jgi:DNA-binding transcriptional LysR family regulator
MPVNFDFNDLYAFRALMEYGSFRLAAESICLSQSALSRRIEKLETALGNRLFDRTTRRVTLTLYGQNFAERSEQLLAHVETVLADISQVSKARTGLVTVATVPSAAYYFMPEIIRSFQARYPQVRIRLIDSSVGNVIEAVSSGQADFGLCFAKNLPASIEFTPLADDRYVAACRHDHPLARKTHLSWQAYFEQDYIVLDRVSNGWSCSNSAAIFGEIHYLRNPPRHHGDAGNLKIDKYRPGAPFSMAGDSIQHALFAIWRNSLFLMPHPCPKTPATRIFSPLFN